VFEAPYAGLGVFENLEAARAIEKSLKQFHITRSRFRPFWNLRPAAWTPAGHFRRACRQTLLRTMRILLDHGTPSGIAKTLSGHDITEAIAVAGSKSLMANCWQPLRKKDLIFCSRPTKTFRYQQNLAARKISICRNLETPLGGLCVCTLIGLRKL